MVATRIMCAFGTGKGEILVMNDEAHHCYQDSCSSTPTTRPTPTTRSVTVEARVWFRGLLDLRRKAGSRSCTTCRRPARHSSDNSRRPSPARPARRLAISASSGSRDPTRSAAPVITHRSVAAGRSPHPNTTGNRTRPARRAQSGGAGRRIDLLRFLRFQPRLTGLIGPVCPNRRQHLARPRRPVRAGGLNGHSTRPRSVTY